MTSFNIFQIYYDETTRRSLEPGFLPLDNTANERPDWYEFWVIRNFLRKSPLAENNWYGFLSPNFYSKTGLTSKTIRDFLEVAKDQCDVALISFAWDQVAYFQNPFEQGEIWHPGIANLSQSVIRHLGYDIDLSKMVTHSQNFTFSNYIIAKPSYWREWQAVADNLFSLIEDQSSDLSESLKRLTSYGSLARQAPIKAFIQERLPSIILSGDKFRVATLDSSATFPIFDKLFDVDRYTRGLLQTCDLLKQKYCRSRSQRYLDLYREIRGLVSLKAI